MNPPEHIQKYPKYSSTQHDILWASVVHAIRLLETIYILLPVQGLHPLSLNNKLR